MSFTWNQLRTETIFVDHYKVERGWHIQRKNPFSSLWYIHKGQVELNVRQGTYLLSPGSVAILPTEIPFEARTPMKIPYARMSLIRFRLWTADQLDWFTLFQLPIKLENEKQAVTEQDFLRIRLAFNEDSPLALYRCNALLSLMIGALIETHMDQIKPVQAPFNRYYFLVRRVIDIMDENLGHSHTIEDLADRVNVSPDRLLDMFHAITGQSPSHVLLHLRIQKAKRLLRGHHKNINDIAQELGFDTPLHFSRLFKKHVGLSPSRYRQEINNV